MLFTALMLMAAAPVDDDVTTLRVSDNATNPCTLWVNGRGYKFSDKSQQADDAIRALGRSGSNYRLEVDQVPIQCGINWTTRLSAAGVNLLTLPFFN